MSEYDIVKVLCAQSLWILVLDSSAYVDADNYNSKEHSSLAKNIPRNVPLRYRPYSDVSEVDWEDLAPSDSTELIGINAVPGLSNHEHLFVVTDFHHFNCNLLFFQNTNLPHSV